MKELKDILLERLEKKGVEPDFIPGLMKSIMSTLRDRPDISSMEVNERLHFLGWENFELDDHTLQLIIANYEANPSTNFDHIRI